jgi:hypothetical protein
MTVTVAMLLLLKPAHLYLLLPFGRLSISPEGLASCFPVLLLYSFIALRFYGVHYETRSHEPLRSDNPRKDSLCLTRIIFIKSSPVMMAWWPSLCENTIAALLAFGIAAVLLSPADCYTCIWLLLSDRQDGEASRPASVTDALKPWSFRVRPWSLM